MENVRIKSQLEHGNVTLAEYIYTLDGVEHSIYKCTLRGYKPSYRWNDHEVHTLAMAIELIELNSVK